MTQNLFTKNQTELSKAIHGSQCPGDCDSCIKFHKAVKSMSALTEGTITLTENKKPLVVPKGRFLVWCNSCSDGENTNFYDACDWADHHATRKHS